MKCRSAERRIYNVHIYSILGVFPYVVFLVEYNGGVSILIEFAFGLFRLLHLISMWETVTSGFEALDVVLVTFGI